MSRAFHFSALKLANRVFRALAGISLFLTIFLTPPIMRELGYDFGMVELWLMRFALFFFPVFFAVMAFLTRRLDKELYQAINPEQENQH